MNQTEIRAAIHGLETEYGFSLTAEEFEKCCAYLTALRIMKLVRA